MFLYGLSTLKRSVPLLCAAALLRLLLPLPIRHPGCGVRRNQRVGGGGCQELARWRNATRLPDRVGHGSEHLLSNPSARISQQHRVVMTATPPNHPSPAWFRWPRVRLTQDGQLVVRFPERLALGCEVDVDGNEPSDVVSSCSLSGHPYQRGRQTNQPKSPERRGAPDTLESNCLEASADFPAGLEIPYRLTGSGHFPSV